jgi:hypothetical protein
MNPGSSVPNLRARFALDAANAARTESLAARQRLRVSDGPSLASST